MYDETRPKDISILLYRTESDIQKGAVKAVRSGIVNILPATVAQHVAHPLVVGKVIGSNLNPTPRHN